jgi:pilus assembly protein Flp/PilA
MLTLLSQIFSVKSQKGVTMIEYALIAALISVVAILLLTQAGDQVKAIFQNIVDALTGAASGSGG